nr:uncharacterized protein LOC127489948 [Oryctolagus cuniculus]
MNLAAPPTTSNATPTLRTLAPTPTPTPYTTLQRRRCHRCSVSERQRQSVLYGVGVGVGVGVSVRSVGVSVGASVRSVGVAFDVVGVAAKFIGGSGLRSRRSPRKQRPEASVFAGNGCSGSEPGSQEAAAVVWASRGTWCSGWRRSIRTTSCMELRSTVGSQPCPPSQCPIAVYGGISSNTPPLPSVSRQPHGLLRDHGHQQARNSFAVSGRNFTIRMHLSHPGPGCVLAPNTFVELLGGRTSRKELHLQRG